ncbi:MAG TPA: hypothetical protein VM096_07890 [Vicinamibacterales bacterium]|nr:hypothetical protein [Vicinamibacterales bacterium]
MNLFARAWCSAVALTLLLPAIAGAQERRNPFTELFGRLPERQGGDVTKIDFRTTSGVQFSQILETDPAAGGGDVPEGLAGSADGMFSLLHATDRLQSQAHARIGYQEYRSDPVWGAPAYDTGGQVSVRASQRLSIDAGGRFTRAPYFQLLPSPAFVFGDVGLAGDPFIAYLTDNQSVEGRAGITADYTKRSSLGISGTWTETHFLKASEDDFSARGFRAQWRRRMSRDLSVHVAYARDEMRQRRLGADRFMNESFDVGVDFATSLPLARRTTLSFVTETSVLRENAGKRHFRLNGTAELAHGFKRTWRSSLSVLRATDFLPGFTAPVFSDTARASLSGYLAKRFILNAGFNATQSQIGFSNGGDYLTYSGDSRLTFAISRHYGIFGQYVYYHYRLPSTAESIVPLPQLSRQSYAFGVRTWLPIVNKDKVKSDPR